MQEEEIQAIKEGFEAKYPQITMNYFFAGTNKVLTKLATEMQSGEISADLVWTGAPSDYRKLKENRYLSPYISPQAININEAFMDEHHYYIGGRLMSAVIAYNTDLVSEEDAPRTWDDLLDPRWNGQIVMTDPGSSGSIKYFVGALMNSPAYGTAYFERLRENGYIAVDGEGNLTLLEPGREIAERIYSRHRLLTHFFMQLGVDEKTAAEDACKAEHILSEQTLEKIRESALRTDAAAQEDE